MSYTNVDDTIREWAAANDQKLFVEWAGAEARFCYLSSPQGECYQISIDAPENELVRVHVWTVETVDDMEAHLEWFVPISQLKTTLDTAQRTIVECLWRRTSLKPG